MALISKIKNNPQYNAKILNVGKVEFSKQPTIFKIRINNIDYVNDQYFKYELTKEHKVYINSLEKNIIKKYSSIPIKSCNSESIIINKIDSKNGNSNLMLDFNDDEDLHAFVVGTIKKKLETIEFFIELQQIFEDYFLIVLDDDSFENNIGFDITEKGLYPLTNHQEVIGGNRLKYISFEQYKNRDNIINKYIKEKISIPVKNFLTLGC